MGTVTDSFRQQLYKSMDLKDTQELIDILKANNKNEWTEEAFDAIKEVLKDRGIENPEQTINSQIHNSRGLKLAELGRPDEAIAEYRAAVRLDPNNKNAQENLAKADKTTVQEQSVAAGRIQGAPGTAQEQPPSNSLSHDPSIGSHLEQALACLEKRKFRDALDECQAVIKVAPQLPLAQDLRKLIQEKKELYTRGGFSILFGIALLASLFNAISNTQGELTTLGLIALGLGILLVVEGLVVALSGMRAGFLIDGIAICLVGVWNLGTSLFAGEVNWLFAGLGVFQLYWGARGMMGYGRKSGMSFQEIERQVSEFADIFEEKATPEVMEKLQQASSAYEQGKNPKKVLQMCDSVLQLDPGMASAHNLRGMVLEDLKKPEEAIIAYREALRLEPAFSDAQDNLSELENRMKKNKFPGR